MTEQYSPYDAVAPYREYSARVKVYCLGGGVQLPLAYAAGAGPTSRVLQCANPTFAAVIEWAGVRERDKPQPPVLTEMGTFLLQEAGGQVDAVTFGTNGYDIVKASGYMVLISADKVENLELPAIWCPYDGRYGQSPSLFAQYLYTPAELGWKKYLPGVTGGITPGEQQYLQQGVSNTLKI